MVRFIILSFFVFSNAHAELGFQQNISENNLVQSKKDSVYKAYFPVPPLYKMNPEQLAAINLGELTPKESDLSDNEWSYAQELLLKRQFEKCKLTPKQDCYFYNSLTRGSLFFVGDSKTIYTAYHNIEGMVSSQIQLLNETTSVLNKIRSHLALLSQITKDATKVDPFDIPQLIALYKTIRVKSVPFIIMNANNEIIYGKNTDDNYISLDYKPELIYSFFGINMLKSYRDFARIRVTKNIGNVLTVEQNDTHGANKFMLGYPVAQDRTSFNKPSSDGKNLSFTQGFTLNIQDLIDRTGLNLESSPEENKETLKKVSYCDCDGAPGQSGGATLNENAEVSFLIAEVLPKDFSTITEDNIISYGPRMNYILDHFLIQDQKIAE